MSLRTVSRGTCVRMLQSFYRRVSGHRTAQSPEPSPRPTDQSHAARYRLSHQPPLPSPAATTADEPPTAPQCCHPESRSHQISELTALRSRIASLQKHCRSLHDLLKSPFRKEQVSDNLMPMMSARRGRDKVSRSQVFDEWHRQSVGMLNGCPQQLI